MQHYRTPMTGRLREPDVPRDDRLEDLTGKEPLKLVTDLERKTSPSIEHREQDAHDVETGVQPLTDELDGLDQVRQTFERVELALHRNEDLVGCCQGIDREDAQGRGAVEKNITKVLGERCTRLAEPVLAALEPD